MKWHMSYFRNIEISETFLQGCYFCCWLPPEPISFSFRITKYASNAMHKHVSVGKSDV